MCKWKGFRGCRIIILKFGMFEDLARILLLNSRSKVSGWTLEFKINAFSQYKSLICFSAKLNKLKFSKIDDFSTNEFQILKYILSKRDFASNSARIRHFTYESKIITIRVLKTSKILSQNWFTWKYLSKPSPKKSHTLNFHVLLNSFMMVLWFDGKFWLETIFDFAICYMLETFHYHPKYVENVPFFT
jgi:hypothetical protein